MAKLTRRNFLAGSALAAAAGLAACNQGGGTAPAGGGNEPAPAEPSGGEEPSGEPHYKEEIVIGMAVQRHGMDSMIIEPVRHEMSMVNGYAEAEGFYLIHISFYIRMFLG